MRKLLLTIITGLFLAVNLGLVHAVDESENQGIKNDCEKIADSKGRGDKSVYDDKKEAKTRTGQKTTGE